MEQIKSYELLSQRVSAHLTRGVRCNVLVTQAQFAPLAAAGEGRKTLPQQGLDPLGILGPGGADRSGREGLLARAPDQAWTT